MDFPKKQQQCLIPRYLLQYLQDLQITHTDPTAPWGGGGGGGSYTAGDGIDITNNVISVDDTVALKTDIPSLTGYATETWVTNQGYLVQSDLSDYVTTSELTTELSNYVTSTDLAAELLNYAELSDIPTKTSDLTNDSGYITSSALTGYATESWVTNQGYSTFSGSYNDLTNKPTIPTKTSDLTNDSGYVTTQELLANYVTLKGTQTISGSKNFTGLTTFQGTYYNVYFGQSTGFSVSDKNNPVQESMSVYPGYLYAHRDTGNTTRDGNFFLGNHYFSAYNSDTEYKIKLVNKGGATTYGEYTFKNKTGDVAITSEIPTATSDLTNDSGYITSSALTGYATESWVTNQGYSTFSGNYNDLTNKPTIPTNYVTTNTTQTITGAKTFNNTVTFSGSNSTTGRFAFTGRNPIKMTAPNNSTTGFTLFDWYNSEKGYLQYNSTQDALYLGRWGNPSSPKYAQNIGFLSELDSYGYRVLMPNKTGVTGAATLTANTYYIPTEITNGTTVVKASSDGIIDISSLISGGGGTTVSGTNDGTNWTSLTIGSDTYGIPSGGGGGSYSAGTGIDITNNTIAIDSTVVALKSDIPSVSGNYSGSYWTKITINGTTKRIPSGGSSADVVDLTSNQNITGVKTFVGKQKLNFKQSASNDTLGFTAINNNNYEIGNLQVANRAVGGSTYPYVTLGNFSTLDEKAKVGFRIQPNSSQRSYNFVMPYGTNDQFTNNGYSTTADTTIPCAFTDGTTIVKADATGLVNISSITGGGSGSSQLYVMVDVTGEVQDQDENVTYIWFSLIADISNMTINDAKELYNSDNANYDFATSAATYPANFNYGQINFSDSTGEHHINSITYDSVNEIATLNYNDGSGSPKTFAFSESVFTRSYISSLANS